MAQLIQVSRRKFLAYVGAAGIATRLSPPLKADQPFTRLNVHNLAPDHPVITSYKTAITQMMALPSTNPLRADATIDSHRSDRIIPGRQSRMSFDAKAADVLWIG